MAWLAAVPEHPDDKKDIKRVSRKAQYETDCVDITMPECDAIYLVEYLFEVGPVISGGMGDAPISHLELDAWQRNTGIELQSWEVRAMHRLSIEYLSESQAAVKFDAPAPWIDAPYVKPVANMTASRMQNAMRELAKL